MTLAETTSGCPRQPRIAAAGQNGSRWVFGWRATDPPQTATVTPIAVSAASHTAPHPASGCSWRFGVDVAGDMPRAAIRAASALRRGLCAGRARPPAASGFARPERLMVACCLRISCEGATRAGAVRGWLLLCRDGRHMASLRPRDRSTQKPNVAEVLTRVLSLRHRHGHWSGCKRSRASPRCRV